MITINNLSKSFDKKTVINNLNLTINSGEITALVGKNGAGKTTLIRLICGLLKSDCGTINIDSREKIGVLLGGDINLYDNLSAYEILHFFGKINFMSDSHIDRQIFELNEILNFKSYMHNNAFSLSRGMKQKIGLALALINNPDIILLDEPSTGLDIETSNDVINFIKYLKSKNKTILIATHNIFEISDLSENIAFLSNGKIYKQVETNAFFKNCDNNEKISHLIGALKGDITEK